MARLHKMELLAPAGGPESVLAAVRRGADGVYLGQKGFSARASAHNFDETQLEEAVRFCHQRGAKVYQALNTLLFDQEQQKLAQCIETAVRCGVDALIVQDLGTAALAREICPSIRLHASTQMTVHTPDGAKLLEELGFARVVLARELSVDEIRAIREQVGLELEVFVHGALCMSVSGQCYLSAMLGGRSGNRGKCAQPCRLPFSSTQKPVYDLSLKDLCAVELLPQLQAAGVDSLKIEGRMKRPEYVAAAVDSYHKALMGETPDLNALQAVFSRNGFTNSYLKGKPSPAMFGTRGKEDVTAAAGVLKTLGNSYRKEMPRVSLEADFMMKTGQPVRLTLRDGDGNAVSAQGEPPQTAISHPMGEEEIKRQLSKLGDTPFFLSGLDAKLDEGLMVPAAQLNALRRECCEELLALRGKTVPRPCAPFRPRPGRSMESSGVPRRYARFARISQIPEELAGIDGILLPVREALVRLEQAAKFKDRCLLELPRVTFGREAALREDLLRLYGAGFRRVWAQNIAQIKTAKELGFLCAGGFGLNIANSVAAERYGALGLCGITLSPELTLKQCRELGSPVPKGVIAYGRLPLMVTRNCPVKNQKSCRECGGKSALTDRLGERFPVVCGEGYSELLNSRPIYMADRLRELGFCDFILLYFTQESAQDCRTVIQAYTGGQPNPPGEYTRGLFYRGVQESSSGRTSSR